MILIPKDHTWDADAGSVILSWPKERRALDGYYDCRMGVCWPASLRSGHGQYYSGYLVLLGTNRHTMATYLFGVHEFQTVADVRSPTGGVAFRGIGDWLLDAWKHYCASTCYWAGDFEVNRKWLLDVSRSETIIAKPSFVETYWSDLKDPTQGILNALQWLNTRRLHVPEAELAAEAAEAGAGRGTITASLRLAPQHLSEPDPDVWALAVAINGIANSPPERI